MSPSHRYASIPAASLMACAALIAAALVAAETSPAQTPARVVLSTLTCPVPAPPPANPDALWNLVGCCTQGLNKDPHCINYNKKYSYIIAKDASPSKPKAFLIIPTDKMIGIEAPQTLKSPTLDIWQDAWTAAGQYLKQPESKTGLAINSLHGRDQNQLHIHISCVNAKVLKALEGVKVSSDPKAPTTLQLPPNNNTYEAVLLRSLAGDSSPFKIVRQLPLISDSNIQNQSVAILKGRDPQTYLFLDTYVHGTDKGEAEELLDQRCNQ
ncbi:MAG: CDP-diacylglycerol diphosphatase [Cyanobacteriota bacterium]|nr:CDP-diacylglycerol diphosphatase [Cyanobacteriota bacterium]